jgi:putative salt-induced outer membrane protein YdiY
MNGFLQPAAGVLGRLSISSAPFSCLLFAGFSAHAGEASGLNFAVSDVFPVTGADLGYRDDAEVLLLAQASAGTDAGNAWASAIPPTDEFDLQFLDWDDVAQVRGHGKKRISIDTPEGPITRVGEVVVTKDKVIVTIDDEKKEFDRSQLISSTPDATSDWDNWSAKVDLGLNFSRGNSDQTDFTAKVNIERRTPEDRFVVDYLGNYSISNDTQTVNNHRLNTFFDMFAVKEYFWRPVFAEHYRDPFQNLDYRTTIGAGAGYHIIDTAKNHLECVRAPAIRATRYVSVQPGDDQKVTTPALVLGTFYDTALTKTVDFNGLFNLSLVNNESGTYTHYAVATFEIELTDILDFDISFVWDRTQGRTTKSSDDSPSVCSFTTGSGFFNTFA